MATLEDGFNLVLADFKKRLKPDERANFEFTKLNDLELAMKDLQERQRKSKTAQNLTRIQPFLQAMMQYKEIIEVYLNASSLLCFVWGPMKFILLIASNWAKSYDILLDTYRHFAENFPLLMQYRSMFQENDHMKKILVWIYEDILKFHLRALRVFTRPTWQQFFNATWKDFQESFKPILNDIARHRELIESKANLTQIQESRDARLQSQASFAALEREQNLAKMLSVVNWLSAADTALDHEDFASRRQFTPDSGRWILEEPKVKDWLDPANSSVPIFWLNGIPGAGKTILASLVVEECLNLADAKKDQVSLAYFYCRDQDSQRNRFPSVAKSILSQLLQQNPDILAYLYDECLKSAKVTLASAHDCAKILDTGLQAAPKTFIVIDGIDECEQKERRAMLNFFVSKINDCEPGKIRAFFISQELNDIKAILYNSEILRLNEQHSKLDIRNYTIKRATDIQERFKLMPDMAKDHIVQLVCEGSDGMFLFAKLVLENLYDQQNLEDVYKEMHPDIFPRGFEQAYARIVNRIFENPNLAQRRTARQLLSWITCAIRPLKWQEIQGATSIDVEHGLVNFEGRQLPDHVREICGSLVDVLPGNRIHLVHKTARQYLIHSKFIDEHKEELLLAVLCIRYLTFECFDATISEDAMRQFLMKGSYAFLDYASLHWNHHLEAAIRFGNSDELCRSADLRIAINDFFEMYNPGPMESSDVQKEYLQSCKSIEKADYYEPLVFLLCHAKTNRIKEEKLEALGALGVIVARVRAILEGLYTRTGRQGAQILDPSTKQNPNDFYGANWYKCSRHACYYFHEGFSNERGLSQHTNRHEKPFCCTEIGCTRMYIGWATQKELKKHIGQYHPDPAAFAWKFPHVKKPPSVFQCNLCTKQFTRANILKTHQLRGHGNERPFVCTTCGKGFVRKYECDRHASTHVRNSVEQPVTVPEDQVIIESSEHEDGSNEFRNDSSLLD